ncbi:unnamed protein product [marine sediment metagenome]|uniref:Uncharacterized protein n=1 Tax=marine sediment metagenome TaxID=412755 RepID=X1TH42_9ZZZZ
MGSPSIYKPKINPEQRIIITHALRAHLLRLVAELNAKRPIGPEQRETADEIEACFLLYRRFRDRAVGRRYPYWWKKKYDSRLTEIYYELMGDARKEELEEEVKPKSGGDS